MGYVLNQFGQWTWQNDGPMDRLTQLQNQRQQMQPVMSAAPPVTPTSAGINWVSGEAGAKSWITAANSTVLLMDSENSFFYLKSADASGMPLPLRVFEYKEVTANAQGLPQGVQKEKNTVNEDLDEKYVTREEYISLQGQCVEIMEMLNGFRVSDPVTTDSKRTSQGGNKPRNKGGNDHGQSAV